MSLSVTFLGTSGAIPTTQRNPSSLMVTREGDRLLFDVGEGTQRQMMRYGTGFAISNIFITHTHGDHVLGLPGLLQTMGFNDREEPLTIHCPKGTESTVQSIAHVGDTTPGFTVSIKTVTPGAVALRRDDYEVRAFETDHDVTSVGYALVEDDRKGRFDREHAEELGVPVGPKFSQLHRGESVELDDGTVVEPDQVVGPPRPGRTLVYTGDTRPTDRVADVAAGADLLIHEATFADDRVERAGMTAHSTGRQAGALADRADVKRLALTHISSRYAANSAPIEREAAEAYNGDLYLAEDGLELDVPYPDAD